MKFVRILVYILEVAGFNLDQIPAVLAQIVLQFSSIQPGKHRKGNSN